MARHIARRWVRQWAEFLQNQDGQTATEYAVMLALIIVVAIGVISRTGMNILWVYERLSAALPV